MKITRKPMQGKNASQLLGEPTPLISRSRERILRLQRKESWRSKHRQPQRIQNGKVRSPSTRIPARRQRRQEASTATTVLHSPRSAIKPLNQLKTLEDATVVYRLVRAPERRVWKIEHGKSLRKSKRNNISAT